MRLINKHLGQCLAQTVASGINTVAAMHYYSIPKQIFISNAVAHNSQFTLIGNWRSIRCG